MSEMRDAAAPEAPAKDTVGRSARAGTIKIRLAENEHDVEDVVRLGERLHRESRYREFGYDAEKLRQFFRRALADRGRHGLLMAMRGEELVGLLTATVGEFYFGHDLAATAVSFYVKPECRGSLAAVKLLHAFRIWARNRGVREIHVNVTTGIHIARTDRFMKHVGFDLLGGNYGARLSASAGGNARRAPE